MKLLTLSKLNAILIIISIFISSSCSFMERNKIMNKHRKNIKSKNWAFDENDKYMQKLENSKKNKNSAVDSIGSQSFLERGSARKDDKSSQASKHKTTKSEQPSKAKTTAKPQVKVIKMKNSKLDTSNKKFIVFEKCKKKTGFAQFAKQNEKDSNQIDLYPIYIVLNTSTLSLFGNTEEGSMFESLKMDKILRLSQRAALASNNCFDIVTETPNKEKLTTICDDDTNSMQKWTNAIQSFKECDLNIELNDDNKKLNTNLAKISSIIKKEKSNEISKKNNLKSQAKVTATKVKSLYYENTPVYDMPKDTAQLEEEMKKEISKMLDFVKKGNVEAEQTKRQMQDQLKEAKKLSEDVKKREDAVEDSETEDEENEKENDKIKMKLFERGKEVDIIKAITSSIKDIQSSEINKIKDNIQTQIDTEKQNADSEANNLMNAVVDEEKLNSYDDCIDTQLLNFTNKKFYSQICLKYFGANKSNECETKTNFCNMCCSHNIGIKNATQLKDCKSKCSGLIEGMNWKDALPNTTTS